MSGNLGETTKLTYYGDDPAKNYTYWFQWKSGHATVHVIYRKSECGSLTSSHSGTTATLTICRAQPEDDCYNLLAVHSGTFSKVIHEDEAVRQKPNPPLCEHSSSHIRRNQTKTCVCQAWLT
jgi:hypothetical protein